MGFRMCRPMAPGKPIACGREPCRFGQFRRRSQPRPDLSRVAWEPWLCPGGTLAVKGEKPPLGDNQIGENKPDARWRRSRPAHRLSSGNVVPHPSTWQVAILPAEADGRGYPAGNAIRVLPTGLAGTISKSGRSRRDPRFFPHHAQARPNCCIGPSRFQQSAIYIARMD